MIFSDTKKNRTFPGFLIHWFPWVVMGILALLVYLGINPFVHQFVILGHAVPGKHGLRVDVFDRLQPKGKTSHSFCNFSEKLTLEKPNSSIKAYGLWKVPQRGSYHLRLDCDDYADLTIDGKNLIHLTGINAHNIGEGEVFLEEGYHVLVLRLFNGPEKGWATLQIIDPQKSFSLLAGDSVIYLEQSNVETWFQAVSVMRQVSLVLLALCLIVLTLMGLIYLVRKPKEIHSREDRVGLEHSIKFLPLLNVSWNWARSWIKKNEENPISRRSNRIFYAVIIFSLLALFAITGLPSGIDSWWDGFPWSQRTETFLWALIIPFFLIIGRRFLSLPKVAFFLFLLLLFKVFLALSAPASGWSIRIYETPEAAQKGAWEKTYTTIWKKGVSDIFSHPYNDFHDFPMEWLNRYNDFPGNPNSPETKRLKARPVVQIWGFANLPPNSSLALAASGLEKGSARANDMNGRAWDIPILENSTQIESVNLNNLPKGKIKVIVELSYSSIKNPQWSLCPIIIEPGGKHYLPFKQGILWQTEEGIHLSQTQYVIFKILAKAIDISLVLFLVFWCGWIVIDLRKQGLLDIVIILTACLTIFLPFVLKKIYPDPLDFLSKGMVLSFVGLIFFGWRKARGPNAWEGKIGVVVLLTAGIGLLSYFAILWGPESARMTLFSMGDDWLTYQNYARHIILNKDYWHSQSPILWTMPFYKYIVALLHVFFGQSVLSLKFLDVWSVIAASAIIASLGCYFKLPLHFALLGSLIYLFHELGDRFSYWIGSGLQEHAAMLFLMLTCWMMTRIRKLFSTVCTGIIASIGFWVRFDHFPVLASAFFLTIESIQGSFKIAWKNWMEQLRKKWKYLVLYLLILCFAVLLIFFRNWVFGGQFILLQSSSLNYYLYHSFNYNLKGIFLLLNAYTDAFSWSAVTLWSGTVIGVISLFVRVGPLRCYPISLGLILFYTILPFFQVWDSCYPPRMSVHLLPLASLSLSVLLYNTWFWIKFRSRETQ